MCFSVSESGVYGSTIWAGSFYCPVRMLGVKPVTSFMSQTCTARTLCRNETDFRTDTEPWWK